LIYNADATIDTELKKCEALRQSILKKAFSGQLVPQNPNDEPAFVLLERIKAEKAANAKDDKKGRTKQTA
jgi:type I restriction enzyme S subunit